MRTIIILILLILAYCTDTQAEQRYDVFVTKSGETIIASESRESDGKIKYIDKRGYQGIIQLSDIEYIYENTVLIEKLGENKIFEEKLAKKLIYLGTSKEVSWVKIKGNRVYIGLSNWTNEFKLIIPFAAFFGNKAIDFGTHVWAYDDLGNINEHVGIYCSASARYGKVYKNNCR